MVDFSIFCPLCNVPWQTIGSKERLCQNNCGLTIFSGYSNEDTLDLTRYFKEDKSSYIRWFDKHFNYRIIYVKDSGIRLNLTGSDIPFDITQQQILTLINFS